MQNKAKAKIHRGEVALGVSLMFPAPQLVEMLAYAGFDWVLIDCEHGSYQMDVHCLHNPATGCDLCPET